MNQNEIQTLIQFTFWANDRILAQCAKLSNDEFCRPVTPDPGWGSLRGILVHTLDTEFGWRANLQSLPADIILEATDFPDVASLKSRWDEEQAAWLKYLDSLTEEMINAGYGDTPKDSPKVWQIIMHVVAHSIQHRSEAAAFLTGLGHSPGELDLSQFLRQQAS